MEILKEIITTTVTSVVGAIVAIAGAYLVAFLKKKVKNEEVRQILTDASNIVLDGVNYVYQTYVEGLKGTDLWDANAMAEANRLASEYIKTNLPNDISIYLAAQGKNLDQWIQEQTEIAINKAKNK